MENVVKNYNLIKQEIQKNSNVKLVAVTKTFPIKHILPIINIDHIHFGENKVQEAQEKWTSIKSDFPKIKLHLIGKLQTNKVKFAIPLFDYIHSLDSQKLADILAKSELESYKKANMLNPHDPEIFVGIGKSLIFIGRNTSNYSSIDEGFEWLYKACNYKKFNNFLSLVIVCLICITPIEGKKN